MEMEMEMPKSALESPKSLTEAWQDKWTSP